jgi:hypothetical protein
MFVVWCGLLFQYLRSFSTHLAPHGDGYYSWIYATSWVFDHDSHFANDYEICGGGSYGDEGGGRPANPFYAGPALLWTPILFIVRHVVRLKGSATIAAQHGCEGPWPRFVGGACLFLTVLTVWLAYRVARRHCRQSYALAGVLVGAFGTTLVTYGSPTWFYSHMYAALGVCLVMLTSTRAFEAPRAMLRWYLVGLSVAFAALMRPQEGLWILLPMVGAVAQILKAERRMRELQRWLKPAAFVVAGFASLYWIQLALYKCLYGHYWLVPQGKLWLQLRHPHPFLMLFSTESGWFTWTPLVWLGCFGWTAMLFRRSTRALVVALLIAMSAEIYISSSALAWTGSGTTGQRYLTSLAGPVVVGAAFFGETAVEWLLRSAARTRAVVMLALTGPLMFVTAGTSLLPASTAPVAYSSAVKSNVGLFSALYGNPFALPASLIFALRYRVPARHFDDLATSGAFIRDYRTAETLSDNVVSFATPPQWLVYAEGLRKTEMGARVRGRGRFLFALFWPYVTHVRLTARVPGNTAATLKLTSRGLFTSTEMGTKTFEPGTQTIEWALPKEALTSGINEVIVESDRGLVLQILEFIDRTDHDLSLF